MTVQTVTGSGEGLLSPVSCLLSPPSGASDDRR
jgi:hypothetical protein